MKSYILGCAFALVASCAIAEVTAELQACRTEADSLKRLTCYDGISSGVVKPTSTPPPTQDSITKSPVTLVTAVLRQQGKDYRKQIFTPRVELVPTFKNDSKKTVIAIEHTLIITDAFGENIINGSSRLDIRIEPGKSSQSVSFYFWEDNSFIQGEPYDRLIGPVNTGVAKATLIVTKAVFADGSIESY